MTFMEIVHKYIINIVRGSLLHRSLSDFNQDTACRMDSRYIIKQFISPFSYRKQLLKIMR